MIPKTKSLLPLFLITIIIFFIPNLTKASWEQTLGPRGIWANEIIHTDSTYWIATNQGVFSSPLNQINWTKHNNGLSNIDVFTMYAYDSILFTGGRGGICRSTDFGQTWSSSNQGITLGANSNYSDWINVFAQAGDTLFVGCKFTGLYFSLDKGLTWLGANAGLPVYYFNPPTSISEIKSILVTDSKIFVGCYYSDTIAFASRGTLQWTLAQATTQLLDPKQLINVNDTIYIGAGNEGVLRSNDNGYTWNIINNGMYANPWIQSIAHLSNGMLIAGSQGNGIYKTIDNGANWFQSNTGLPISTIAPYCMDINNGRILITSEYGIWYSDDNAQTWVEANDGLYYRDVNSMIVKNNFLYAGTDKGVWRSFDGYNWELTSNGLKKYLLQEHLKSERISSNSSFLMVSTGYGNFYCNDSLNWIQQPINSNYTSIVSYQDTFYISQWNNLYKFHNPAIIADTLLNGPRFASIDIKNSVIIASELSSMSGGPYSFYYSGNLGINWLTLDSLILGSSNNIVHTSTDFYTSLYSSLLSSPDGLTWSTVATGFNEDISTLYSYNDYLFVGTYDSTIYSSYNGTGWNNIKSNLPDGIINSIIVKDNYIYLGLRNQGVWRRLLTEVLDIHSVSGNSNQVIIYPNPVTEYLYINVDANITFDFEIFNSLGQLVISEYNVVSSSGFSIKTNSLNNGVYLIRVRTGNEIKSSKFIKI